MARYGYGSRRDSFDRYGGRELRGDEYGMAGGFSAPRGRAPYGGYADYNTSGRYGGRDEYGEWGGYGARDDYGYQAGYGSNAGGWRGGSGASGAGGQALEGYGYGTPGQGDNWAGPGGIGSRDMSLGEDRGPGRYFGYADPSRGWSSPPGATDLGRWGGANDYGGFGGVRDERHGISRDWNNSRGWGTSTAADIMTENPEAVTPETTLAQVAQRMRDLDVGIIPVVEDEESYRLQGVITDRDITVRAAAEGKDMKKTTVGDVMTTDVETCHLSEDVSGVMGVMKRSQVRRVPIVDDDGKLVGIIAQADLAVEYAGMDDQRELAVEETIERISEPAHPRWGRDWQQGGRYIAHGNRWDYGGSAGYDRDITDRVREGWHAVKRGARDLIGPGYDRGWR